jgi:hypothetical protein
LTGDSSGNGAGVGFNGDAFSTINWDFLDMEIMGTLLLSDRDRARPPDQEEKEEEGKGRRKERGEKGGVLDSVDHLTGLVDPSDRNLKKISVVSCPLLQCLAAAAYYYNALPLM